jgi:nitrous oxide reductase accessory protein NosL
MKKTSFVIAIVTSALLAGACGKKKDAAAPTPPAGDMGSAAGSGGDAGSGSGSGSSM